jgi:hypothetical protein
MIDMKSPLSLKERRDIFNDIINSSEENLESKISGCCLFSGDYKLSISVCEYFLKSNNENILNSVIHGIGYICMNFNQIDMNLLSNAIRMCSIYPNLSFAASDCIDDYRNYVEMKK